MPSHQTSPSSVSATLVKIVSRLMESIAIGLLLYDVPGGDAEESGLRIDGVQAGRPCRV
jgi:hypothetical protein